MRPHLLTCVELSSLCTKASYRSALLSEPLSTTELTTCRANEHIKYHWPSSSLHQPFNQLRYYSSLRALGGLCLKDVSRKQRKHCADLETRISHHMSSMLNGTRFEKPLSNKSNNKGRNNCSLKCGKAQIDDGAFCLLQSSVSIVPTVGKLSKPFRDVLIISRVVLDQYLHHLLPSNCWRVKSLRLLGHGNLHGPHRRFDELCIYSIHRPKNRDACWSWCLRFVSTSICNLLVRCSK